MTKRPTNWRPKKQPTLQPSICYFHLRSQAYRNFFPISAAVQKAGYNNETARRQAATVALAGFREAKIALQWPNTGARFLQGCLIPAEEGYKHTSLVAVDRPDKLS